MKNTLLITLAGVLIISLIAIPIVFSDDDNWKHYRQKSLGVSQANNEIYLEECGSCHMAYQPGLLTTPSWEKLMNGLGNHFDDNAELDNETHQAILKFLTANSADKSAYRRSKKFSRFINPDNAPLRITETPYFIHEHDEISVRMVKDNDKIKSFSHCNACHQRADQGMYDEHSVIIPGYGRWDD